MKKSIRFVASLIAVTLVISVFANIEITRADAQNIQVTPYPKTAGTQASYQVKFNINSALQAGKDSISVIFPKETNLDSTISSGNICVNPKELVGADFELDYRTGTVRLMNPLRKGDRVVVDYRYQPGPDYTQLPRNVKFYDLTYGAGNVRSGNGQLDAGEWIYEDRDNDSKISVGDRRLCIVFTGGVTYRQGSLVQVGDNDFGVGADPTRPVTSFSSTNLTFVDNNNDGIYNENDWLVDDRNQNNYLDRNDVLIAGIFDYQAGSIVEGTDLDIATGPVLRLGNDPIVASDYVFTDTVSENGIYDYGEYMYEKTTVLALNKEVQVGDTRWSWVISGDNLYPPQTVVVAGDTDIGTPVKIFPWSATSFSEGYTNNVTPTPLPAPPLFNGWRIYRLVNNTIAAAVSAGNYRKTDMRFAQYAPTAPVAGTDADTGKPLFPFATNEKFHDTDGDTNYWWTDPVYRDLDNNSTVSEGDLRLTDFVAWDGSNQIHYTAGSIVRNCETDVGLALSTFQSSINRYRHAENGIPNNNFEPGEMIVWDADGNNSVSAGDTRFSYYGVMSANVSVMNDQYSDCGLTLTKGWTDIRGEVLVNFADGGEQILKLAHYPVIAPVIPQDNDVNYRVVPIQLPSNPTNFKNSGKWYYIVTALSDTLNEESPPWTERMVDFTSGNMNAVHLTWSPVPNASKYKVYRTKDAGSYGEDSLVAVVKAPFTSYIDVGCYPLRGTPRPEYRSSFTKIIIDRPLTGGSYTTRQMNEYELSDYKIDCKTGLITFRKSLKQLDTVVADYDVAEHITNEKIIIDTISGRGQLRHGEIIDPDLFGEEEYKLELRKVNATNPNYPTVLVRGVDYQFMDENNDALEGLKKGTIVFYTQISEGDSVYADYFYREKVRGDLVAVANGNETQLRTHQNNIVPGTYTVYKGKTLSSAPVINVMNSERGPLVTFTTPVNVIPEPAYQVNPTPESKRDVTIVFSLQTGIRNPSKAGNYQLYIRTSQEQTEILSNPYVIEAGNETQTLIKLTQDQSVSAGQTIALTCAVQDNLGNMIPNTAVNYSIISSPNNEGVLNKENFVTDSSGNAVAMYTTSKTPGLNTVQAHIVGTNQSVTFKINALSSQPITRIEVSPKDARVLPNGTQKFMAVGYNSAGETVPNIKFIWTVNPSNLGNISGDGTFTAGSTTGTGTIVAEAYGVRATANVTVASGQSKVARIVLNPSQAEVSVGETVQFTARAYDENGSEISVPFSWTVGNEEFASITQNGLLTAKKPGTVIVIATEPGGMNQYATVTIVKGEPGISYIEIHPNEYQMNVGQSVQFAVHAYDQAGDRFTPNNITWTSSNNIGVITNTGVFTATSVGIGSVTAQVGNLTASAEVTVHSASEEDKIGPVITIISPKDGDTISDNSVVVRGTAVDPSGVKQVLVNNVQANLNADGTFTSQSVAIVSGSNMITIVATDNRNNMTIKSITVMKSVPVIIKLQIGNRNAVILRNNMPQLVTIDLAPFTTEGRTMVPLRFITESFGAVVDWKPDVPATGEGQITITLDQSNGDRVQLIMHTGSTFMKKITTRNGVSSEDAINYSPAPYIVKPQDRTVVPLRFISEQFGATVDWDSTTQEITITYYP